MAIVLSAISGQVITPDVVNQFNFMSNSDSQILNHEAFSYLKSSVSIGSYKSYPSADWLISQLNSGNVLILQYRGSCEWTNYQHFVVAVDYKKSGGTDYIYISNPNRYGPNGWVNINRVKISALIAACPISGK